MNRIIRHGATEPVLGLVQNDPAQPGVEFASMAELLRIEWVAKWQRVTGFYRFSCAHYRDHSVLLVELDEGTVWWVVGYLREAVPDLPVWVRPQL